MAVAFPGYNQFVEMFDAGYSMFDNGNGAYQYFSNLTPASAFAADVKLMNFAGEPGDDQRQRLVQRHVGQRHHHGLGME
jgi:hypothetical protein